MSNTEREKTCDSRPSDDYDSATKTCQNQHEHYIRIWEKAVDTQMHFNEMSAKSRQLGLTFVAAALGVGVVLLSRGYAFSFALPAWLGGIQIHIVVLLALVAVLALTAVRQLDLKVYHRMLRGAVTFGEDFESNYMKRIFDLDKGMTEAISHFSRYKDAKATVDKYGRRKYAGNKKSTAEEKIKRFYNVSIISLLVIAAALGVLTNVATWGEGNELPRAELVVTDERRETSGPVLDDTNKDAAPANSAQEAAPSESGGAE